MIGQRIRELRKQHNFSQTQLAMKLHLTQGAISQWETGQTIPAADQLSALADVFGITVDDLLGRPATQETEEEDVWELRERLRRDPDMRILFDAAAKATPEHIKAAAAMLKALEPPESEVD